MAHVSRKLSNALEGALAGGGDPATSPLYVFGPFLRLVVVAGVAQITFGASIWLVILTVALVSAMYRLVMVWITDGSGGSGLSEEEFGGWAVKMNAGITFVEYTLTFLVSMAALVTFLADRSQCSHRLAGQPGAQDGGPRLWPGHGRRFAAPLGHGHRHHRPARPAIAHA
jgi:hypothetical protein